MLLFGAETWVLIYLIERALKRFWHRVAQWLTRRQSRRGEGGIWDYTPLVSAMVEAEFGEIRAYVTRRQNTVAQYIAT